MPHHHHFFPILCVLFKIWGDTHRVFALKEKITLVIANDGLCQSNDTRLFLRNTVSKKLEVFKEVADCGTGLWRSVFHLNMSNLNHTCPHEWNLVSNPVRSCAGASNSCCSAFSNEINFSYSKVCGRIIGYAERTPDAYSRHPPTNNIETNYVDGVSITHGACGSRTHIWTLGAGHPIQNFLGLNSRCPCDSVDRVNAPLPPTEVGEHYFCDTRLDRLWTGVNCASNDPCCTFHNPPYFSRQLSTPTISNIELRICQDQNKSDEEVLVEFAEVFVQ